MRIRHPQTAGLPEKDRSLKTRCLEPAPGRRWVSRTLRLARTNPRIPKLAGNLAFEIFATHPKGTATTRRSRQSFSQAPSTGSAAATGMLGGGICGRSEFPASSSPLNTAKITMESRPKALSQWMPDHSKTAD
jgi:hypothetical protein